MKGIKNWFKNFKFKEKWGELVVFISPIIFSVLFGVSSIREYLGIWWFLAIITCFAIITILGWVFSIEINESVSILKDKNLNLKDKKEHLEGILSALPEEFSKLLSQKWELQSDSRITIYRYNSTHFIPVSRYSKNPDYDNINRESYPKDVGYISKCWAEEEGKYFNYLPDPKGDLQYYKSYTHEETGMLKKDIERLVMKSRSFYGKTLYDENRKAYLIVMIESIEPEIKNIKQIRRDLESTLSEFVISIVKSNIAPGGGDISE